jgi:hypothetical protein
LKKQASSKNNYSDFASVMTHARMNRYLLACSSNTRKTMTLYRKNLQLTQELFTVISCFEVALRNAALLYGLDHINTVCNEIDNV